MRKLFLFLMALFAGFFFSIPLNAQTDGFFRSYDDNESRDINGIGNQTFGQSTGGPYSPSTVVPLGSGLIILMTAGAGYALVKRKRSNNMKKVFTIISVLVVILGLTQCKKKNENFANVQNTAHIILHVDGDSKVNVNTGTGQVAFTEGDVIYVGYNCNYVGTLIHDGDKFVGNLPITPSGKQKLHFYFLGNLTPTINGNQLTVDINDQRNNLPVISYAPSNEDFTGSGSYTAMLKNKCGLVKFTPNNIPGTIRLTGLYNRFRADLSNNSIGSWATGDSYIDLYKVSNTECWAILLKDDQRSATAKSFGYLRQTGITVPAITNNTYLTEGIAITLTKAPEAAFSTSENDTYIYFATGNLQCTKTGATWDDGYSWRFMTNQYDIDHYNTCDVGVDYANKSVISHFGWGASGYNGEASLNYKPNSTTKEKTADVRNPYHYGPSWTADPDPANYNTAGVDIAGSNYDWGVYHSACGGIMAGDNPSPYNWRLFTKAEIAYILGPNVENTPIPGKNCRYSSTINGVENARFVKVRLTDASNGTEIPGLNGLIIFPDVYEHPDPTVAPYVSYPEEINNLTCSFTSNTYSIAQWEAMEAKGAIFLPAAGCHDGHKIDGINTQCYYWTSTYSNYKSSDDTPPGLAKNLRVGDDSMVTDSRTQRWRGNSVRLVRNALEP